MTDKLEVLDPATGDVVGVHAVADKADVEATMKAAHDICPISDLIRASHDVELIAG